MNRLNFTLFLLIFGLLQPIAQAQLLQLPNGTPVQLRLDTEVNRYYNKEGDMVPLSVSKDVYDSSGQFLLIQKETPVVAIFHTEGEKKTAILEILPKAIRAIDGQVVELSGKATLSDSASGLHKFFNSTLGTFQAGQIITASTLRDMTFDISSEQELNRKLETLERQRAEEAYQNAHYAQILGASAQALGQFYQYKQSVQPTFTPKIMPNTFHTTNCNSYGSTVTCTGN